jgi:hypothetical protein
MYSKMQRTPIGMSIMYVNVGCEVCIRCTGDMGSVIKVAKLTWLLGTAIACTLRRMNQSNLAVETHAPRNIHIHMFAHLAFPRHVKW